MSSTKSLAIQSISWKGFGAFAQLFFGFAFTLLLMRYISPDAYGVVAKVYIILSLFNVFLDFGFSMGIVQSKEKSRSFLSSHFYLSLMIAVGLAIIMIASAKSISVFYQVPELQHILYALSANLVIGGLVIVHRAVLQKKLRFKALSIIQFIGFFISGLIALILAYFGYGYYAIIAQIIVLNIIQSILLWTFSRFTPSLHFSWQDIRKTSQFSVYIFFIQVINYASEILDQFLSSIYFSQDTLGKYNRSISLTRTPVRLIPSTFGNVLFPLFTHSIQEKGIDRNEELYIRSSCIVFHLIAPLLSIICIAPRTIVEFLLPTEWWDISPYIQLLAFISLFMILEIEGSLFLSKGKSQELAKVSTVNKIIRIASIVIGIANGLMALLYALLCAEIIMRMVYLFSVRFYLKGNIVLYLKRLAIPLVSTLFFAGIVYCLKYIFALNGIAFLISSIISYLLYLTISYRFEIGQGGKDLGVLIKTIRSRNTGLQ